MYLKWYQWLCRKKSLWTGINSLYKCFIWNTDTFICAALSSWMLRDLPTWQCILHTIFMQIPHNHANLCFCYFTASEITHSCTGLIPTHCPSKIDNFLVSSDCVLKALKDFQKFLQIMIIHPIGHLVKFCQAFIYIHLRGLIMGLNIENWGHLFLLT